MPITDHKGIPGMESGNLCLAIPFCCMYVISILGNMLSMLLSDSQEIRFDACLTQIFFIHCFSILDSGVLWAMAFDCFMATYNRLQYESILTNPS
ncbi:hypothetical protein QYF61_002453 [Mycteria americana]|uniref:G-protein coupled receptors family 1 profile domain-containing protein n=1 Tax=Mycteria americana TaxID=33587 RepID=A0AAN7SIA4_MYCAM|nr:hypothetical protein QYF61_002453 [Mycteria americana]